MALPQKVTIVEVGPRDGFQMETAFIPTDLKTTIINTIAASGVSKIEATAFVSPTVIPQMRDARQVMEAIDRHPGVCYSVLVPNVKGAELAVAAKVDAIRVVICASEAYSQRNVGMSIAESMEACRQVREVARAHRVAAEVVVGLAFGCPLEGDIPEDRVVDLTGQLTTMGYGDVSIADSVGLGNPTKVRRMMRRLQQLFPGVHFSLHLHNTRGLGLANVVAGLEEGIDTFDCSIGGLGGCPVVPGARGNIPTEDVVNMLEEMGIQTGIDIDRVLDASRVAQEFLGRSLPSHILAVGTREQLYRRLARQHSG